MNRFVPRESRRRFRQRFASGKDPHARPGAASPWLPLLAPYRGLFALLLVCQLGQSFSALALPSLAAAVIDRGVLRHDTAFILRLSAVMAEVAAAQLVFASGTAWLGARIAMSFGRALRSAVFATVQRFSLNEVRRFGPPSLITRTTNDVQQLQTVLVMLLTMVMTAPVMGIGGIMMAVRQDGHLARLLLVSVPILAVIIGVITARSLPLFTVMQGQIDRLNQVLREQIRGVRVIRAFVRDGYERDRFAAANDALTDTSLRVGRLVALNMPSVGLVMQLSSVAIVWFGARRIAAAQMDVGSLVAFLAYIAQILISVMIASLLFAIAPRALVSARRIEEVLHTPSSVAEPKSPAVLPPESLLRGQVAFQSVSFSYPGADHAILEDLSFTIAPGETVAVIGATGSGKSTVLNLVPRLFDVTGGAVQVAGRDVRELALADLWRMIGIVPQQPFLFSGTIADNLRYGRAEAGDDDLWRALEVAQAREFVEALPQRLAAPVAQGGGNFSGGQRQRLTIARALVRRPAIYLLDDCFSALDFATDARLRAALRQEIGPEAATLIVGQRVSSLREATRIIVLEQGRIVGVGAHEELLRASPTYQAIVASQRAAEAAL